MSTTTKNKDSVVQEEPILTKIEIRGQEYTVDLKEVRTSTKKILLNENVDFSIECEAFYIDDDLYFISTSQGKLFITKNINRIWHRRSRLYTRITKKNVIFFGLYSKLNKRFGDCDNVLLNDVPCTRVVRPFNFWKFRHLGYIKIPLEQIHASGEIHSTLKVGKDTVYNTQIKLRRRHKGMNYYSRRCVNDSYYLIRTVVTNANIRIVNIPMSPEYTRLNRFKNAVACTLGKILGHKRIVLMFEKETKKANESGYYVFEKIMERKDLKSKVYFVIDKNCDDFNKVYSKYPKNTLKKYSFKHYLYIYLSSYFVSSELSNHVINPRLYIASINNEIVSKPLVFLQHGIMFAKPVDNPAAAGFRKDSPSVNYYKSVISSDLEATQFYKCGFEDADLIKCGLPKFDISTMDPAADKIMIMLTYRFWEEALIINEDSIKETSYYKVYMNLINAFEKAGLLDKLLISCHPKFADCIIKAAPKYESIVEKDINRGLELSKIFITDYSSASYDSHYRGAYIIYYWEERDYLIENYQAIPPVNEYNCDGVPVFDTDSLIKEVKKAIDNNYVMDEMYEERYRKINEYHDNKNGERLVNELIKLDII